MMEQDRKRKRGRYKAWETDEESESDEELKLEPHHKTESRRLERRKRKRIEKDVREVVVEKDNLNEEMPMVLDMAEELAILERDIVNLRAELDEDAEDETEDEDEHDIGTLHQRPATGESDEESDPFPDQELNQESESEGLHEAIEYSLTEKSWGKKKYTEMASVDELMMDSLLMYLTNHMSKKNLTDHLKILKKTRPNDKIPTTANTLFRRLEKIIPSVPITKHFYFCKCKTCKGNIQSTFYEFDVGSQIKTLFETCSLKKKLREFHLKSSEEDQICDVIDGSCYQVANDRPNRGLHDLSLIMNVDGVSVSKNMHCWPVMFTICELPPAMRNSCILFGGLWYHHTKPPMSEFIKPLGQQLDQYFKHGIKWLDHETNEEKESRIVVPVVSADSPARSELLNSSYSAGIFGCNVCEIEQTEIKVLKRKRKKNDDNVEDFEERGKRVYLYPDKPPTLRTSKRIKFHALEAEKNPNRICRGIKGTTELSNFPGLDIGTALVPEGLHSLLNVIEAFFNLWFEEKGPWNISEKKQEILEFLIEIETPTFINRPPSNLKELKFTKASEFIFWLLFFSVPATSAYLKKPYFDHYLLLVEAIFLLLKDKITEIDISGAELLLDIFVKKTQELYGEKYMKYSIHLILHFALMVRRAGPIWAVWAFVFESFNHIIASSVHGGHSIGQELANNLVLLAKLSPLKYKVESGRDNTPSQDPATVIKLWPAVEKNFTDGEKNVLREANLDENVKVINRISVGYSFYSSLSWKSLYKNKNNDHTIEYKLHNDKETQFGEIKFFVVENNRLFFMIKKMIVQPELYFKNSEIAIKLNHIVPILESDDICLIPFDELRDLKLVVRVGDFCCLQPVAFSKNL